ncbi:MAG TPA: Flp family type IVb pilin [Caldisericia bacterium]|nr:Flp family type IVb pilin [Caldisericia bacterium]HPO29053.1 Flp family type IVb pilin [Caldisericia bacterium]HXK70526.1 Flp family type IVb pilin [Caldisericia bacterium]
MGKEEKLAKKFLKDESGQTILEYALIIAVLVLVIIAAIPDLRDAVLGVFGGVEAELESAPGFVQP